MTKPQPLRTSAYVVVDASRTALEKGYLLAGHPNPLPEIGQVFVFQEPLPDSYIRDEIDGPVRDVIELQRVADAVALLPDGSPCFTAQAGRALALIQIGAEAERVLRERMHALTEEVRDLVNNVFAGHPELEAVSTQLSTIERRFRERS